MLRNGPVLLWKTSEKSLEPILRSNDNEFLLPNFRSTFLFYISWKYKKQCYKNTRFSYPWHIAKLKKNYTLEFLKKLMFWVRSEVILQKSSLSPTTLVQKQTNVNFAYTWPSSDQPLLPNVPILYPLEWKHQKTKGFLVFSE